jgi:hypothetical protein
MNLSLGSIFVLGAVVLMVLAVIGTASSNGQSLGVDWDTWQSAGLLSFFASLLVRGLAWPSRGGDT